MIVLYFYVDHVTTGYDTPPQKLPANYLQQTDNYTVIMAIFHLSKQYDIILQKMQKLQFQN